MARLIDANEALEKLRKAEPELHIVTTLGFKAVDISAFINFLESQKIVNAVEVIRCKDCQNSEHCKPYNKVWCPKMGRYMKQDGFCSEGVMKDAV